MKLGIITDIHEHVEYLRSALDALRRQNVDQIVVIGDIYETGKQLNAACDLLADSQVVGVWGNHDYGLCVDPPDDLNGKFSDNALGFMSSLKPQLEIEGCHFSHVEPWLDPTRIEDIWYFKGAPDCPESLDRIFDAVPSRIMLTGHNHRWLLAKREGVCDWDGSELVDLSAHRYFVVVGALCDGYFATLDTSTSILTPQHVTSC